jgi:hypothetical protein
MAAGELDRGGVVILATDGKDENSATTVEDVARHCQASGVTILTVGTGSVVEEKPLRRLALLTDGQHLGFLDGLEPGRLGSLVLEATAAARQEQVRLLAERQGSGSSSESPPESSPEEPARGVGEPEREAATVPTRESESAGVATTLLLLALFVLLLVLGALFLWLWRRGRGSRESYCSRCGSELEAGASCARCEGERLREELEGREILTPDEVVEVPKDRELGTETVDENTRPVTLEATRVLEQRNVLVLREPGASPRSFFLSSDKAFGLGRDPSINSISLADPAMSARHLKIVPEAGEFYVVDLRSTNGSSVNGSRVAAQILRPGDLIRAGQVELEFRSHLEAHN